MTRRLWIVVSVAVLGPPATTRAGLIQNGSFETVPAGGATGQGLLPSNWLDVTSFVPGADTYSNNGSYGLSPGSFGNFTGVTAFDGQRFLAGSAFGRPAGTSTIGGEGFAATLTAPLVAGAAYRLDAALYQAVRSDLNNPGGYDLFLVSDTTPTGLRGAVKVGSFDPTTGAGAWEPRSLTFTAPPDAATRPNLVFAPYQSGAGNSYPGIDATSLNAVPVSAAVPEPTTLATFGLFGAIGLALRRRRRHSST